MLSALRALTHQSSQPFGGGTYHPHLTDEETEVLGC